MRPLGVYYPFKPASRVLVADVTLNDSGNSDDYAVMLTYNWVSIDGAYETDGVPRLSAHLNGNIPLGGNVGMLDGHVEWRNFKDMQARTGSTLYFYW
jgi:prepilin-type processing-associated H-X9-DG protein